MSALTCRKYPPYYRLTCVDIDYMAGMPSSPKELPQSFGAILMKPSALVPVMMSLAALADVVVSIAIFGIVHVVLQRQAGGLLGLRVHEVEPAGTVQGKAFD